MSKILELEEAWELIRKLYGKKKEGWSAYIGRKDDLFEFLFKGPGIVIEIVQDQPHPFMLGDISRLPEPWKPLGKGAILDINPNLIPNAIGAYGLRPVSREMLETLMKISYMSQKKEEKEKILKAYDNILRRHVRTPVVGYNEISSPIISIGPFYHSNLNLDDISPSQKKLRENLKLR
jgi:hypothetical protein